jgi:hypothetical protein
MLPKLSHQMKAAVSRPLRIACVRMYASTHDLQCVVFITAALVGCIAKQPISRTAANIRERTRRG